MSASRWSPDRPSPGARWDLGRAWTLRRWAVGEGNLPRALRGRRTVTAAFADPADLALAIPATAARSPERPAGDDLAAARLADGVMLLAFSEFGRRPAENESLGTDHVTGPVFLAGSKAKAGLIGETPQLGEQVDGDLKWSIDFRRVYATLLDRLLGVPAEAVVGRRFQPLSMLRG
jgi:hypothetical protein